MCWKILVVKESKRVFGRNGVTVGRVLRKRCEAVRGNIRRGEVTFLASSFH
jgi:hypothetical protein